LTFWSGDGGTSGVASLLGGVIFESLCSVNLWRAAGQRHGEEDGGLPEDSSFLCPRLRKVDRRRALVRRLEGLSSVWQWRGDSFVGPYASYDHEVGKETRVGGAHRVHDETDVGRGFQ